jgi:acetylornithine deacetylase/succinyl-diaminopimelate desuccinylase-like protein
MKLTEYIDSKREEHLNDLYEFLRIPSVSAQSEHKPDIERAAKWVAGRLSAAGLENVEIVPTKMHPLVYGESLHAPGKPTILFYGHYDVQPAEPLNLWTSPAFEPTIRGGYLYGRGTADDKGQVHIHIRALDAILKTAGKLPINLKVMIEGEEEVGSVSLWEFVNANRAKLKADALVVSDTGMLAAGVPSITYGLRGLNYYQIEITGPAQDLHSGIFGGAVPNPVTILCELIAKLHDKNMRVAVPGFYDDVAKLSRAELKALNSLPWKASTFRKTVGAPGLSGEKGASIIEQLWTRPTLELNGIWGGYTGEGAKTVIASKAYAKFSTRLVPNQNPEKITKALERHIRNLLPKTVKFKLELLWRTTRWRRDSGSGPCSSVKGDRFHLSRRCMTRSRCRAFCWASDCRMKTRTRRMSIFRWKIILEGSRRWRSFMRGWGSCSDLGADFGSTGFRLRGLAAAKSILPGQNPHRLKPALLGLRQNF